MAIANIFGVRVAKITHVILDCQEQSLLLSLLLTNPSYDRTKPTFNLLNKVELQLTNGKWDESPTKYHSSTQQYDTIWGVPSMGYPNSWMFHTGKT